MFSQVKAFGVKLNLLHQHQCRNVGQFVLPDYFHIFLFTRSLADAEGRVWWHYSVVSECTAIKIWRFSQEEERM
jgi:hypothetical protein